MRIPLAQVLKYVSPWHEIHCNPEILPGFLWCFQRVATLNAVTVSRLVLSAAIGAGIEQRATAGTEIYVRFIGAFTIWA